MNFLGLIDLRVTCGGRMEELESKKMAVQTNVVPIAGTPEDALPS